MPTPETLILGTGLALLVFLPSATVVYWKSGQRRLEWREWLAAVKEGKLWHLLTIVSALIVTLGLITMQILTISRELG